MTAHESSEQAEHAERRDIGDTTVEQMRTDVQRLSRQYMTGQPLPLFFEMRRVRDRMHTALDRRLWPRDATEIYFLLAALNGLMANAALDLGYHQAAEELIRAGWAYAIAIDHRPLMGFLRGKQASVAYWRGYPLRARELAQDGLAYLPDGTGAVLLHCRHAIPAARLGEPDEAAAAVTSAHEARDRGPRDVLHDEIGGEFGCSPAKESYLAGTALADMPQSEPAAIRELQTAVRLYSSGPAEERSYGCEALAHINLAVVHIRKGALDAVDLEPVFGLPSAKRIDALPQRLAAVRTELAQPIFRGSAQARELGERIEEFSHDTVVADLHDLPGGPA
jgi:hypothetical protein